MLDLMEKELLVRVSTGDEKAFRVLYDTYSTKVYTVAWKLTGVRSVAEDVVQEVFIKLWLHRDKMSEINYFTSYLNTVTRNHIFNALRKIAHEDAFIRKFIMQKQVHARDGFDIILYNQLQQLVTRAVEELPGQQKKVYLLSRSEGLPHNQIASLLKISKSTVTGHMVEALRFIRNYLHKHMYHILFLALTILY